MTEENKLTNDSRLPLVAGLLAALGASLCCVGPFVLLFLGISGSWMSNLMIFEPYRPMLILAVIATFAWTGWKNYRPVEDYQPDTACATPKAQLRRHSVFWLTAALALILVTGNWWVPLVA